MIRFGFLKNKFFLDGSIVLLISLIFHWPLIFGGFSQTDDGSLMLIRQGAFFNSFADLHIPVRIVDNLNYSYGYPIFNFFYPGFFYLGQLFHIFGFGLQASVKLSLFFLGFLGGFGFYLLSQKISNSRLVSIFVATFYIFSPYHIIDLYQRGSFGEIFVLAFIPFTVLGVFSYLKSKQKKWLVTSVISSVLVIIGHNSQALILLPAAYFFAVILFGFKKQNFINLLIPIFFSVGISSWFWIPALLERHYTVQPQIIIANFYDHFPKSSNLLVDFPFITSFGITGSKIYPISFFTLVFFFLALFLFFIDHHHKTWRIKIIFTLFVLVASVTMITPISTFLWENLGLGALIQFPWRFLSLTTLSVAILAILTLSYFKKINTWILIFLIFTIVVFYLPQIKYSPNQLPDDYFLTNDSTTLNQSELSTVWFDKNLDHRPESLISSDKSVAVENLTQKTQKITFIVTVDENTQVTVNKMYFPKWRLKIDGQEKEISYQTNGLINFSVPAGQHLVELDFTDTFLRKISNIVSIVSLLGFIGLLFKYRK